MKKSALIRSDKPHAVEMAPGTRVAKRKSAAPKSAVPDAPPAPESSLQAAPTQAVKTRRVAPAQAPAVVETPASPPPKRRAKPKVKAAARPPRPSRAKTAPATVAPAAPVAPPVPLWEKDSPIKTQIQELQALNAQLSEQLQRLLSSRPARGSMP